MMDKQRILCVTAHPDDEILFLYPVFQRARDYELALLPLCANAHKGDGPLTAAAEVCVENRVKLYLPPLADNQFYRLPTRYADVTLMGAVRAAQEQIARALQDFHPEAICTHNPWGEYGHGDHRLTFTLASQLGLPLLLTDICLANECHLSTAGIPAFYRPLFANPLRSCTLEEAWYTRMQGIYEKHHAWTWGGHEPVRRAKLHLFQGGVPCVA